MMFMRWLDEIDRNDLAIAGGKGANLGELFQAGLPVPPAFILTTAAYRAFVDANGLQPQILLLAAQGAEQQTAAGEIQALFQGRTIPDPLLQEIRAAYARLAEQGPAAVAVRSSATAEDLPDASFAGQQETYLNLRGEGALLGAVRRCWASLWANQAMAYRARREIPPDVVALAVVVRQLVPAAAAGILFTANPANGRRHQTVSDAAWGLGEAVFGF